MESRSAPVSNEVSRPETSTSETRPDWRILMEKSAMVTVQALSGGRKPFYLWNRRGTSNIPKKQKIVKEMLVQLRRVPSGNLQLAHHYAESAAPAFREAHANDFQIGREIFQELVGGGVKSQRGRDHINERRGLLQRNAGKIAVTSNFSALQLAQNAQPVVGGRSEEHTSELQSR